MGRGHRAIHRTCTGQKAGKGNELLHSNLDTRHRTAGRVLQQWWPAPAPNTHLLLRLLLLVLLEGGWAVCHLLPQLLTFMQQLLNLRAYVDHMWFGCLHDRMFDQ